MKIGIFGGSFNPIHTGHAMLANYLSQSGLVDCIWFMVSPLNPLKVDNRPIEIKHRLAMCELVAHDCANVMVSDFETSLPQPTYTYRTLCALRKRYPEHSFTLLIGSDNWEIIDKWRNYKEIISEFPIIIYPRPGYDIDRAALPPGVELLDDVPQVLLSSSKVRSLLHEKKNVNFMLPCAVKDYIQKHRLYE